MARIEGQPWEVAWMATIAAALGSGRAVEVRERPALRATVQLDVVVVRYGEAAKAGDTEIALKAVEQRKDCCDRRDEAQMAMV